MLRLFKAFAANSNEWEADEYYFATNYRRRDSQTQYPMLISNYKASGPMSHLACTANNKMEIS
jgi:hypothetical protein